MTNRGNAGLKRKISQLKSRCRLRLQFQHLKAPLVKAAPPANTWGAKPNRPQPATGSRHSYTKRGDSLPLWMLGARWRRFAGRAGLSATAPPQRPPDTQQTIATKGPHVALCYSQSPNHKVAAGYLPTPPCTCRIAQSNRIRNAVVPRKRVAILALPLARYIAISAAFFQAGGIHAIQRSDGDTDT